MQRSVYHAAIIQAREAGGRRLAHILGISLFLSILMDRIVSVPPFANIFSDLPLAGILIYLLVERRVSYRYRMSPFDWLNFALAIGFAATAVFADVTGRESDLMSVLVPIRLIGRFYLYFVAARIGSLQPGFSPTVCINYFIAGITASALIGLAQTANLPGVRAGVDALYHQAEAATSIEGNSSPNQARGTAVHANQHAMECVFCMAAILGIAITRGRKVWYYAIPGIIIIASIAASQARTGALAMAAELLAVIVWFAVRGQRRRAIVAGGVLFGILGLGILAMYAFQVKRFVGLLSPPKVASGEATASLTYRLKNSGKALSAAVDASPIFGLSPDTRYLSNSHIVYRNADAVTGRADNTFVVLFSEAGLLGIVFGLGTPLVGFLQLRRKEKRLPWYCPALFICAFGYVIEGTAEIVTMNRPMIWVCILMGFVVAYDEVQKARLKREAERPLLASGATGSLPVTGKPAAGTALTS